VHELINSVKMKEKKYQACFCGRLIRRKRVYDLLEIREKVRIADLNCCAEGNDVFGRTFTTFV
jgi:hypothetical protein